MFTVSIEMFSTHTDTKFLYNNSLVCLKNVINLHSGIKKKLHRKTISFGIDF
jgi:hypothetical protein